MNSVRIETVNCPFCHKWSAPPITVVEASRPTTVSPSIGTVFAMM